MMLNHCSAGNIQNQIFSFYSPNSSTHEYKPFSNHFVSLGFVEILELKENNERSEEDTENNITTSTELFRKNYFLTDLANCKVQTAGKFQNFKHLTPHLYILFHNWRYHI
jgi:hypothetical protein